MITPALTLNKLLEESGIALGDVLVFRHRPWEPALNKVFDWIVAERPELFDCYQSTHGQRTEAALARADYVASFIRYRPGQALFVGLYKVHGQRSLPVDECVARALHRELMIHGLTGDKATIGRTNILEFDLRLTDWHTDWQQRLIIGWPGLERSWYRWADRNVFPVQAIAEEGRLIAPMPAWDQLALDWQQLGFLPTSWRDALSHWRGVYLIIDRSDGKQYVGSAYGVENILQRWLAYARSGHGGNRGLLSRDPANFIFSILQRVSPDLPDADVIAIENTWKVRLRTKAPDGLNEN